MGKKFIASYSGGKDSMLAIHRAIAQGLEPVALIITYNTDKNRSWFHGIPQPVLDSVSRSLGIPIWLVQTSGEQYAEHFEQALCRGREAGAELCVFGDIDIEGHRQWCGQRCQSTGLELLLPLWQEPRNKLVYEFIDHGYTANFTVINQAKMSDRFLGQPLTRQTADLLEQQGVDICGENGEYHTFVSAGPLFGRPVAFTFGERLVEKGYAILPILG